MFQKWVTDTASLFWWRWWHVPAPMVHRRGGEWVGASQAAGLCDLILTHQDPPTIVFAEVKGTGGKLSDAQREFLQSVRLASDGAGNIGVYVWQPGDEPTVEQILRTRVLQ